MLVSDFHFAEWLKSHTCYIEGIDLLLQDAFSGGQLAWRKERTEWGHSPLALRWEFPPWLVNQYPWSLWAGSLSVELCATKGHWPLPVTWARWLNPWSRESRYPRACSQRASLPVDNSFEMKELQPKDDFGSVEPEWRKIEVPHEMFSGKKVPL